MDDQSMSPALNHIDSEASQLDIDLNGRLIL